MSTGSTLVATGQLTLSTAQMLLKDIPADRFARLPHAQVGAVPTNHPAWVYGHLGLYGGGIAGMVGRDDLAQAAAAPEGWDKLFGMGSTCEDDPEQKVYPPMVETVAQFEKSFDAMLEATKSADDATLELANPNERMRERFPTVGIALAFMLGGHPMFHLGQVSAWRRVEGLGSALNL